MRAAGWQVDAIPAEVAGVLDSGIRSLDDIAVLYGFRRGTAPSRAVAASTPARPLTDDELYAQLFGS